MGPLFPRQITLSESESIPHLSAPSVFFIPSSSLRGAFEGQKRISGALSRGLFAAANDDLGNGAYIFCCAPS